MSVLIVLAGGLGLALQFQVTHGIFEARGQGLDDTLSKLTSYFTILTNALLTLAHAILVAAPRSRAGIWLAQPAVQGGLLLHMGIVGLVYVILLAGLWNPQGSQWWADNLLHRVTPLLQAGFWLALVPKVRLPWSSTMAWQIYPALYLPWALGRGATTGDFPYPFLDAGQLGWPRVFVNAGEMSLAFLVGGLLLAGISRLLAHRADEAV